jgi:hypothetical protein
MRLQRTFLTSRRVAGPLIGCGTPNTKRVASAARRSKQLLMRSLAELIRCICLISPAPHMFCVGFVRRLFVIACGLHYPPHSSTGVFTCSLCGAGWCRPMPVLIFAYRFPHVSNLSVFMRLCISCRFRLNQFCSTLSDAFRSPHHRHMLLVPMSVHSLFKYFQLVSAHALSSTVHDSPRRFREKTLKRALQFLPKEGEKEPRDLINHLEWGLRGAKHKQSFPALPKASKPKAKTNASSSSDSDGEGGMSFSGSLWNESESD